MIEYAFAAFDDYVGTTTALAGDVASTIFNGFFDVILTVLPYAIGILIFYIGYRMARRALAGR